MIGSESRIKMVSFIAARSWPKHDCRQSYAPCYECRHTIQRAALTTSGTDPATVTHRACQCSRAPVFVNRPGFPKMYELNTQIGRNEEHSLRRNCDTCNAIHKYAGWTEEIDADYLR